MSTEVAAALVLAETKVCPSVDLSIGSVFGLLGAARLCLVYRAGRRVSQYHNLPLQMISSIHTVVGGGDQSEK